ncbi:MAG: amidohydrolase [Proteobacteria bacterium]|nr:amidohydrolase [Pseudomonadota bacterium]MCH9027588.1 amidohydrolase [Pseudomonadota bacterium]
MGKSNLFLTAVFLSGCMLYGAAGAEESDLLSQARQATQDIEAQLIDWRRHFHANPELSNREFNTARKIAVHLRELGLDVETGVAHTGVVALVRGKSLHPMVALRADIDALPVSERNDLPFASKVTTTYNNQETGVMHACGHDTHIAILMAAAEVLVGMKDRLSGSVLLIFQPAEEGPPEGEEGGARLMLDEGLFERYPVDVAFGLHTWSALNAGVIGYRSGPMMASYDNFKIRVQGLQAHASKPWRSIDPIVVAAQIVLGIQTIASRQVNVTLAPSVISIGSIHGGIRNNIIPDEVEMLGTIRSFDAGMRKDIQRRLVTTVENIAESAGTTATVEFHYGYPVTVNDPELTAAMLPTLRSIAGADNVIEIDLITGAEDFSYFQQEVPGFYFMLGATPAGQDASVAPTNHSPLFLVDESTLLVGLDALIGVTLSYMDLQEAD